MNNKNFKNYEKSYLLLITFIVIQIFLIFLNIYNTQEFSIELFTIIIVELISILLAYFMGLVPAAIFSTVYVIGYIYYVVVGENNTNLISYILMFFIPLYIICSGNMNRERKEIMSDLNKLDELENIKLKMDPYTQLENEVAFKEVLSKHCNLAYRYESYNFSVSIFRIEFIETIRMLLDPKEFNELLENIAKIIKDTIREEDYKFIVSNNRFVIITPLTSFRAIAPAIRRILEDVGKLEIKNNSSERIDIVLKAGGLDYTNENHEIFKEYKKLLLELQKTTEVDIYGEYDN